jgi:histidine triad (HIT) family protein
MSDPAMKVIFENDLVLFMQNERYQGALKHSGVIIPVQHKETVFDLSEAEVIATFRL